MCPYSKICNCIIIGFITTKIVLCPYAKGKCFYLEEAIREEPEIETKISNYIPLPAGDQAIVMSGSALFARSGLGRYFGTLFDGRNIYGIDPTSVSTTFVVTNEKTGERMGIDLETFKEGLEDKNV